jgi:RHS repeat-associated protein
MRTYWDGSVEATYQSLPWGDGFSASGADDDPYHFAGLDQDASSLDHAQYREYFNVAGRWMSPDPYGGSYDFANPQSFNRYAYVNGRPLSMTDPSGKFGLCGATAALAVLATGGPVGPEASGILCGVSIAAIIGEDIFRLFGLFQPAFHGSLQPRPSAGGDPNWDGNFGESLGISTKLPRPDWGIAEALGLPTLADINCLPICDADTNDLDENADQLSQAMQNTGAPGTIGSVCFPFLFYGASAAAAGSVETVANWSEIQAAAQANYSEWYGKAVSWLYKRSAPEVLRYVNAAVSYFALVKQTCKAH